MQRTLENLAKILQQIREFFAFLARKIYAISVLNASVCVAKCCINSNESCANVKSFTPHALGKCNRVFRAPRAETAKILQEIRVLTTQILRERAAKRADFRHRTHLRRSRERCLRFKVFRNDAGWIGGVLRITDAENLRRVRELLRGKFSRSRRSRRCTRIFCVAKRCTDSSEDAAPPQTRIWQTSRVLCSARSRNSRKFCNEFANFWLFVRGKFARSRC